MVHTPSYTAIQASHVSTGTTNNALVLNPSGGNVGVGTTAPQAKIHAYSASYPSVLLTDAAATPNTFDILIDTPINVALMRASGRLDFETPSGSKRMTMLANGNVGIGTTAPIAPLHVVNSSSGLTSVHYGTGGGNPAQWYTVVGNYATTTGSVLTIPIVNQGGNWTTNMFRIRGFNGRYNNGGSPLHFTVDCSTVTLATGYGGVTVLSTAGNVASVTFNQSTVSLLINFTGAYGVGAIAVVIEYLATLQGATVIPTSISAN